MIGFLKKSKGNQKSRQPCRCTIYSTFWNAMSRRNSRWGEVIGKGILRGLVMRFLRDRVKKHIPVKGTEIHLTRVVLVTMLIRLKDIPMTGTETRMYIDWFCQSLRKKYIPVKGTETQQFYRMLSSETSKKTYPHDGDGNSISVIPFLNYYYIKSISIMGTETSVYSCAAWIYLVKKVSPWRGRKLSIISPPI